MAIAAVEGTSKGKAHKHQDKAPEEQEISRENELKKRAHAERDALNLKKQPSLMEELKKALEKQKADAKKEFDKALKSVQLEKTVPEIKEELVHKAVLGNFNETLEELQLQETANLKSFDQRKKEVDELMATAQNRFNALNDLLELAPYENLLTPERQYENMFTPEKQPDKRAKQEQDLAKLRLEDLQKPGVSLEKVVQGSMTYAKAAIAAMDKIVPLGKDQIYGAREAVRQLVEDTLKTQLFKDTLTEPQRIMFEKMEEAPERDRIKYEEDALLRALGPKFKAGEIDKNDARAVVLSKLCEYLSNLNRVLDGEQRLENNAMAVRKAAADMLSAAGRLEKNPKDEDEKNAAKNALKTTICDAETKTESKGATQHTRLEATRRALIALEDYFGTTGSHGDINKSVHGLHAELLKAQKAAAATAEAQAA
jgi:hypothetical protein